MKASYWDEGYHARRNGKRLNDNPYERGMPEWDMWIRGFNCRTA